MNRELGNTSGRLGLWTQRNAVIFTLLWTVLILALLSIPGNSLGTSQLWKLDKLGHAAMFLVLALLSMNAVRTGSNRVMLAVAAAGLLFGPASEWYQSIIPMGRFADPLDALANVVGFAVGLLCWYRLSSRRRGNSA